MSDEIRIKKSSLLGVVLVLACLAAALLVLQISDIKRELRMWTM